MKYFKLFEQYNENLKQNLIDWSYEYAKDHHEGLNSYEDAMEELDIFFNSEFDILNKESVKLYRVLQVGSIEDINREDLGEHYLHPYYIDRIYEKGWYDSIGIEINDFEELFLVEIETIPSNIEWEYTINNRLNFPREFEVTLKNTPIIKSVVKIEKENIK